MSARNPFVPLEIVREIAECVYVSETPAAATRICNLDDLGISTKPPWRALASLSRASKSYREVALEIWFRSLRVSFASEIDTGCSMFPAIPRQWTRSLHCTLRQLISYKSFDIDMFRRLEILRIDRMGQHNHRWEDGAVVNSPFELFPKTQANVIEIEVNGMLVPSPSIFSGIQVFGNLKILKLRQRRIWCDLCNLTCLLFLERPFPKSIVYENGAGLSIHYMKSLSCLRRLESVTITTNVYEANGFVLGETNASNPFAWSGECDHCIRSVMSDDEFRLPWVSLKTGEIEEMEGFGKRKYRFHKIPSLKRVEWCFVDIPVVPEEEEFNEDLDNTE